METWRCRVKVVVNENASASFNIRMDAVAPLVNIKIIIRKSEDIHGLLDRVDEVLNPHYQWNVEWNWKNTPRIIIEDVILRKRIIERFSSTKVADFSKQGIIKHISSPDPTKLCVIPRVSEDIDKLVARLSAHISIHGQAPDLSNLNNLKKQCKAVNYIRNTLARHDLSDEAVLTVARRTNAKLNTS